MRKYSTLIEAQTTQNIWNFMVGKSSLQEIATLAIIQEISDSNMETGRYGPKSGVSRIIQESWQHWITGNGLPPKNFQSGGALLITGAPSM